MRYARIIYVIIMRRTFYEAAICVCRQGRTVDANSRGEGAPEPDTLDSQRTFDLLDSVVIGIRQSLQLVRPVTVERDTLNQIITCETQHGPFSSRTLTKRTAPVDVKICECNVLSIEYTIRSAERRVGKKCVSTFRDRW